MNILYLTLTDPICVAIGGEQRTHVVHKALRSCGTVYTAIPVFRKKWVRTDPERKIAWVYLERRGSFKWLMRNLFLRLVPWIAMPSSTSFRSPPEWRGVKFDAVVARQAQLAAYFQAWTVAPLVLDSDDVPTEYYTTLTSQGERRLVHELPHFIIQKWFNWICLRARHIWVAHSGQLQMLETTTTASVLPNIPFLSDASTPVSVKQESMLLTVGSMFHPPNYLGVQRFLDECWPLIHRTFPQLRYVIAGGSCPEDYAARWRQVAGVEVVGYVEDIAASYQRALCTVAPVYRGSGTCIKVLESLGMGRCCLGPPFAMRGIREQDRVPSNGLFVCETGADYVQALYILLEGDTRRAIQDECGSFVRANWSQQTMDRSVREALRSLSTGGPTAVGP